MASAHPLAPPANEEPNGPGRIAAGVAAAEHALVPVPHVTEQDDCSEWNGPVARLPVELDVAVPVREFRVRNLLALEPGQVVESRWGHVEDVPLASGAVQLAWSEFEVIDTQLAVRLTRLV